LKRIQHSRGVARETGDQSSGKSSPWVDIEDEDVCGTKALDDQLFLAVLVFALVLAKYRA